MTHPTNPTPPKVDAQAWLSQRDEFELADFAREVYGDTLTPSSTYRYAAVLRSLGYSRRKTRRGRRKVSLWRRGGATQAPPPTIDEQRATHRTRQQRDTARKDLRQALERIDDLERALERYEDIASQPLPRIEPVRLRPGLRPAAAVALLSDVHAEERVVPTAAISNRYDLAIAEHRVGRFFAGVEWLVAKTSRDFAIDTLVLWLGGDLITGDIHEELLETAEVPPASAVLAIRGWLVAGLRRVLAALPELSVVVPCSYGNHGRTTKKTRAATGYGHSWEWLLYHVLASDFADEPRVHFSVTTDAIQYVDVLDYTLAFSHGDAMRYNGGVGGITIPATKAVLRWQRWKQCDYYHFGHFHTRIDLGEFAFNGSVIGPSPFGLRIGAPPEPPQQSFYVLDAKRGKAMSTPVWVGE
jgi:hypothetical protein